MHTSDSEKSIHQVRIERFMRLANQEVKLSPTLPSLEVRRLRAGLILEEALETIEALGFHVFPKNSDRSLSIGKLELEPLEIQPSTKDQEREMLVEILDGCADISVVNTGTLSACGVMDGPLLALVDMNNLAKFGPGHSFREDGKLIKPEGHKPPDIKNLIERLGG